MKKDSSKDSSKDDVFDVDKFVKKIHILAIIVKHFGPGTTLIIFLMIFMIFIATPAQQSEFIDKWILFKGAAPCLNLFIITTILTIVIIIQFSSFSNAKSTLKKEIERLSEEKTKWQELFIKDRPLSSSQFNKKVRKTK